MIEPGEVVLAEGRAHDWSPTLEGPPNVDVFLVVTAERILGSWSPVVWSLPFDRVLGAEEATQKHRYAMRLRHTKIERHDPVGRPLPWDLPRHLRCRRWASRSGRETVLAFSRRDTEAATAIRSRLARLEWRPAGRYLRRYLGSWWGAD
jgi:hypothetical protein